MRRLTGQPVELALGAQFDDGGTVATMAGAQVIQAPRHARAAFEVDDLPRTSVTLTLILPCSSTCATSPTIRVPRRMT